jgi:hypothetical protein
MHAKNIDTVTVTTSRDTVVVPWESRQRLLERLRWRLKPAAAEVVDAFERVGTSRKVTLTPEGEKLLAEEVEGWLLEVGTTGLPAGIFELRKALIDEQHLSR